VVLRSVPPVHDYPLKPGLEPAPKIVALNAWMTRYAESAGEIYLDHHSAMKEARDGAAAGAGEGWGALDRGRRTSRPATGSILLASLRGVQLRSFENH
jgi:hypothetical protein